MDWPESPLLAAWDLHGTLPAHVTSEWDGLCHCESAPGDNDGTSIFIGTVSRPDCLFCPLFVVFFGTLK